MFKFLLLGGAAWAGHRAWKADQIGLPLDMAFRTDHLFKSVDDVKGNLVAAGVLQPVRKAATAGVARDISYDPDAVMVPDWMR